MGLNDASNGTPNFIFPLEGPAYLTVTNGSYFQELLYRPLYFFGAMTNDPVGLNEPDSLAYPPVYSNGGKTVTIKLKHYMWSDGTPVTSRDITFFMNLLVANKTQYGAYTQGDFPDNVTSYKAEGPDEVVFQLKRSYSHNWFTNDELGLITPFPQQVWDKTSANGKVGNYDTTTAGSKAVFKFLTNESKNISTYQTNPLWKVVDGPWKMEKFETTGYVEFVPNPRYSGPTKPKLSRFVEQPFTSDTSQFDALLAGKITVGYLPTEDLPRQSEVSAAGYSPVKQADFYINFIEENFNNPTVGPLIRQLYIRQALQTTVDQPGMVKSIFLGKGGYADYGPLPPQPPNPYIKAAGSGNPYPYSISTAKKLLTEHGWKIPSSGPATCVRPGSGANECGAKIPAGKKLSFNLLYTSGNGPMSQEMQVFKSDAGQAGIRLNLSSEPFNTVVGQVLPCTAHQAICSWQLGTWGGWTYSSYPTGELLFASGAPDNSSNYSNAKADRLIRAVLYSNAGDALTSYARYIARQLPALWQPAPYTINEVSNKLRGVVFNSVGGLTPENWYYAK